MTPRGRTLVVDGVFVSRRFGAASIGVVSVSVLLLASASGPLAWSSVIDAVFERFSRPAAMVFVARTANRTLPPSWVKTPIVNVHFAPALPPLAHDQPAVLSAALKVEFAGTMSVMTTPVTSTPVSSYARVQVAID